MSTTQLIASAVATAVAALGASFLGVYGTIIGAALMSVISTAGSAVGKHYLDQGREQIKELTHLQSAVRRREMAEGAAGEARSADPTRTVAWPGDPGATRLDPVFGGGDPNATRFDPGGDPNATRLDPAQTVAAAFAEEAGEDAVRQVVRRSAWQSTAEWAKAHWVKLVVSSAAVFAVVVGGITIYEAGTGRPVGGAGGKGLTVTKVLDGGGRAKPADTPSQNPSGGTTEEPGSSPSGTPTGEAPTGGPGSTAPQPSSEPTERPTRQPTTVPPTTAPTTPEAPATTGAPQDGGQGGSDPQGRATPSG
ncbi:hypothetical protein BKA00_003349 [Actinomadura coerulea]|uniref:Uncharacterized protein n=1 Tax=Actinomadura coerulea TaxID=46159 RepID=A0A7X0KZG9_9ACTN|nr:hypothetical protein [Actinomadura coerulea]MBB6396435.1 hypothetical protein [Actinomadura coerulea]